MRLAGYVHRDISSGNCMWYRAEGQGKISDLEFAVPYDLLTQDEPRKVSYCFGSCLAHSD